MRAKALERDLYPSVKAWLEELLRQRFATVHLEITAKRKFSNVLKQQIDQGREVIFYFLREAPPDLAGFVREASGLRTFVVVEVKREPIRLDDIYQARKYAELFDATIALLVSPHEIPEEIRRLSRAVHGLLAVPAYKDLTLVRFVDGTGVEWFPKDPFAAGR